MPHDDAYSRLSRMMSELQQVLGRPEYWPESEYERVNRAAQFRMDLWQAMREYAEESYR